MQKSKLYLLDMDGTIYIGDRLFDYTREFLEKVRQSGGKYLFFTNNSSKSVAAYVDKLGRMGIDCIEEDFVTSSQATAVYLKKHFAKKKLYVFGTQSLKDELSREGLQITDVYDPDICCLVMGFDTELTFQKLEDACRLLNRGVAYIATNPDLVCPTSYGSVPDCGSVAAMLKNATGREPRVIGKPAPEMVYLAMEKTGFAKKDTYVVGDRLYTDIACGNNAGVTSILVLSGETKPEDVAASKDKPAIILNHILEIDQKI